jgi:hypothetical protein
MKYKVTAKKFIGSHVINDWFKGELSHLAYFTDSISDAKKQVEARVKNNKYYTNDCHPQIISASSGKEVVM